MGKYYWIRAEQLIGSAILGISGTIFVITLAWFNHVTFWGLASIVSSILVISSAIAQEINYKEEK